MLFALGALLGRLLLRATLLGLALRAPSLSLFARHAFLLCALGARLGRLFLIATLLLFALDPPLFGFLARPALLLLFLGVLLGGFLVVATLALLAFDAPPLSLLARLALGLFACLVLLLFPLGARLGRLLVRAPLLLLAFDAPSLSLFARLALALLTIGPPLGVLGLVTTLQLLGGKHGCFAQLCQRLANGLIQPNLVLDVRRCFAHLADGLAKARGDLREHVGSEEDQRHEKNNEDLLEAEVQHGVVSRSESPAVPDRIEGD